MDYNTPIGFSHASSKAYCKECKHMFKYHWNSCNPFSENNTCPKCGRHDTVESEHRIEMHIDTLKMFRDMKDNSDEQRLRFRREISDLNKLRRMFDEYDTKNW